MSKGNLDKIIEELEKGLPEINFAYANSLPDSVKKAVEEHLYYLKEERKWKYFELKNGILKRQIEQLYYFRKIFIDSSDNIEMMNIWQKLDSISSKHTHNFVLRLFYLPEAFFKHLNTDTDNQKEIKDFKKIIKQITDLEDILGKSKHNFYLITNGKEIKNVLKSINVLKRETISLCESHTEILKKHKEREYSREKQSENAEAIFFARIISKIFRTTFKKPLNKIVASIVNNIFDTEYQANNITKFYSTVLDKEPKKIDIHKLIKSDNSINLKK